MGTRLGIAAAGLWAAWAGMAAAQQAGSAAPLSGPVGPVPLAVVAQCSYGIVGSTGRVDGDAPCRAVPSLRPPAASAGDPTRASHVPIARPLLPVRPPIPASNPVGLVPQAGAPAAGFEPIWEDGRVNPARGVPRPVSGPAVLGVTAVLAR